MLARFRSTYQKIMMPLGKFSAGLGLGPDFWTFFSVALSIVAAVFLSQTMWGWGLLFSALANLADGMDGATARARGMESRFGTVLDQSGVAAEAAYLAKLQSGRRAPPDSVYSRDRLDDQSTGVSGVLRCGGSWAGHHLCK